MKKIFLNTVGYVNGFGVFNANKMLKPIGKKVTAYGNFRLFNSALSKNAILEISADKYHRRIALVHKQIEMIVRTILYDKIRNNYLSMYINKELCNDCGLCVKNCPTSSIIIDN